MGIESELTRKQVSTPEARYVRNLSRAEENALRKLYRQTQNADLRTHCQMILLSAQEYTVSEIAGLTLPNEDPVGTGAARSRLFIFRPEKSCIGL